MKLFIAIVALALAADAQTPLRVRYGGPASSYYATLVSPGTPPSITMQSGFGFVVDDFVSVNDITGIPALKNGVFKVASVAGNVITLKNQDNSTLAAPGKWYGGGRLGRVQFMNIAAGTASRLLIGPDNDAYLTDPDGAGPLVAPKLAEYPDSPIWTKMLAHVTGCETYEACASIGRSGDVVAGRAPLYNALVWRADKSRTINRDGAIDMIRNFHLYYNSVKEGGFYGCVEWTTLCGFSDGEALDSRGWLHEMWVRAYDIIKSELTLQERQDFAAKIFNGVLGRPCNNPYLPEVGTVSVAAGGTDVTGFGTSFSGADVGKFIFLWDTRTSVWNSNLQKGTGWQWFQIASVTSPTALTINTSPLFSSSNKTFTLSKPWTREANWCGTSWVTGHHPKASAVLIGRQMAKLGVAISSATQTTITLDNPDVFGNLTLPFNVYAAGEVMTFTAKNGAAYDVLRGQYGTTPLAAWSVSAARLFASNVMAYESGASEGKYNSSPSGGFVSDSNWAHNLTWAKIYGMVHAGLALADVSEDARLALEVSWNLMYDTLYPHWKDSFTWTQNGGMAYIRRYVNWLAFLAVAMRNTSGGAIDITDGDWLKNSFLHYGPNFYPWDQHRFFTYSDTATVSSYWDAVRNNDGFLHLSYLYPNDDRSGWARWYMYTAETPSVWSRLDDYSFDVAWAWEPGGITCPSTTPGRKCFDHRTGVPHMFTLATDYDPAATCPTFPTSTPGSCWRNPDNGYLYGISWSDWGTSATVVKYQAPGASRDHMPGYAAAGDYQAHKNAYMFGAVGGSGCANCLKQGVITQRVVTDAEMGMATIADHSTFGSNACGSRGIVNRVPRIIGVAGYSAWTGDATCNYRATFGVTRSYRTIVHLKSGAPSTQDYVVAFDDINTTGAQRLGVHLPYHNINSTPVTGFSRTGGEISYSPQANAKILTSVVLEPANYTYTESDYNTSDGRQTRIVLAAESVAATGARNLGLFHKLTTSSASAQTPYSVLSSSANSWALLISDPGLPRVTVFDKNLSDQNTVVSWTVPGGTANTQTVVTGLALASTYEVTKDGTPILTGVTTGNHGTIEITGHGPGSFVASVSGSAVPPQITTTSLPGGTQGVSYSQNLAATGCVGSCTWAINSGTLCAGLSLSTSGTISGTPTTPQTCNFNVKATDTQPLDDTQDLSIVIAPSATPLELSVDPLITCTNGVGCVFSLSATGGTTPYTFSTLQLLPPGLELNPGTGGVSGVPTMIGDWLLTGQVADSGSQDDDQVFKIRILPNTGLVIKRAVATQDAIHVTFSGALNAALPCKAILRDIANQEVSADLTVEVGPSLRKAVFTGLPAGETYIPQLSCTTVGAEGPPLTIPESVSGTQTVQLKMNAPAGRGITNVLVEHGLSGALGASTSQACSPGCVVSIEVPRGSILHYRRTWRDAGNAAVGLPSPIDTEPVGMPSP